MYKAKEVFKLIDKTVFHAEIKSLFDSVMYWTPSLCDGDELNKKRLSVSLQNIKPLYLL